MTHEDILSLGFIFAPVMFKTLPPYTKGEGGFNRYEHPNMNMAMQHYVDEDRFVMQRVLENIPYFNGRCVDAHELLRAIKSGSAMSDGDTVTAKGNRGFLAVGNVVSGNHPFGFTHFIVDSDEFVLCYCYETELLLSRNVLTEKRLEECTERA